MTTKLFVLATATVCAALSSCAQWSGPESASAGDGRSLADPASTSEAAWSPQQVSPQDPPKDPSQDPEKEGRRQDSERRSRSGSTPLMRQLFSSKSYQERFAQSYIAETEIEPSVTVEERDVMLKVLDYISSDRTEDAIRLIERNRNDASSAVFDFTIANLKFQADDLDPAKELYQQAIEKTPKFRRAWNNLGQIHYRQENVAEAAVCFAKVLEYGGNDPVTYGLLGICHLRNDQALAAEAAFSRAIMLDPATIDWKFGMAESFFKQQRYPEAAALFQTLIERQRDRADLWLAQGEAFARMKQMEKATQNYEIVDLLGGSTVDSLNNLGDLYATQSLFDLAVSGYERALRLSKDAPVSRAIGAAKYMAANNALDAAKTMIAAIMTLRADELDTEAQKDLLKVRARIAVAEGAGEEETRVLEQIVELDPLDGDALILLGQQAGRNGDVEKAIFYYERAANISEAFEADANVRHGQLLVGEGRLQEAIPLLKRAQTLKPRNNVQEYLDNVERFARGR